MGRAAIFFDRDGVLNVDHGYVSRIEEFEWVPGARAALASAHRQGFLTVVVTNQSGIARGMYTEADFHALMAHVREEEPIDAVYFCPHHPDFGVTCDCRKPRPGMLLQAIADLNIDPAQSFLVGDSPTDLEAADAVGIPSFLFTGGDLHRALVGFGVLREG